MNILFLDIDGVLNTENAIMLNHYYRKDENFAFDENCVDYLNYICKKYDFKIVVSSTWRRSGLDNIRKQLYDNGVKGDVIDTTTFEHLENRGAEIQKWLDEHESEISNYIILDDDTDMLETQEKHFVNCNFVYGLTCIEIYQIEEIMKEN